MRASESTQKESYMKTSLKYFLNGSVMVLLFATTSFAKAPGKEEPLNSAGKGILQALLTDTAVMKDFHHLAKHGDLVANGGLTITPNGNKYNVIVSESKSAAGKGATLTITETVKDGKTSYKSEVKHHD